MNEKKWLGKLAMIGLLLAFSFGALTLLVRPAAAVERVVTTAADSGPGSLRQVLADAQPGDKITFDFTSPTTITVNSPLVIDKDVTIEGLGPNTLVLQPYVGLGTGFLANGEHVIDVDVGATAVISGVRVMGGAWIASVGGIYNAGTLALQESVISQGRGRGIHNTGCLTAVDTTIEGCEVNPDVAPGDPNGGGIFNDGGTLILERSALIGNSAYNTGGTGGAAAMGGGLYNTGPATITQSIIRSNWAENGGGIANGGTAETGGVLVVIESEIVGNDAELVSPGTTLDDEDDQGHGGGLYDQNYAFQCSTTILRSTFDDNWAAQDGGAIYASDRITVTNTTLLQNRADRNGGAIYYTGGSDDDLLLYAVTMVGNAADYDGDGEGVGGGIYFGDAYSSQQPQIGASAVVENTIGDPWGWPQVESDCAGGGELRSLDYNVFGTVVSCTLTGSTDHTVTGSYYNEVSAFALDHGGPTRTFPPHRTSFNIANQIPVTACVATTDQRGLPRPQGAGCDIGAYELGTMGWDGGAGDGLWTSDANWNLDVQPGGGDRVVLDGMSPATITVAPSEFRNVWDLTVAGLEISNPNLTLAHGETLNVYREPFDLSAGTFNGAAEDWLQVYDLNLSGSGVFNAPGRTLINEDLNATGGTFNPNQGVVEMREGIIDHGTQYIVGPLTLYDLWVTRYYTDAVVEAAGDLTVTHRLTVEKGTFHSSSSYHHVRIEAEGRLYLSGDITVSGDWINYGTVLTNGHVISFTGTGPQALQETRVVSGSAPVRFLDDGGGGGVVVHPNGQNLGQVTVAVDLNEECTTVGDDVFARCFDLETEHPPASGVTLTFFFYPDEIPAGQSCSGSEVYHWNGSAWEAMARDSGYGIDGRMCAAEPCSVRVEDVTDFSPFVLRSGGTPEGTPGDEYIVYLPLILRQ